MRNSNTTSDKIWIKARGNNLYRYAPTGMFYVKCRIAGKLFKKSLDTKIESVAKCKLADFIKEKRIEMNVAGDLGGSMTFRHARDLLVKRIDTDTRLKSRGKEYRLECIKRVFATWPGLENREIRRLTKDNCLDWAKTVREKYAPSTFNNTVGTLRMLIEIAIEKKVRLDNPADAIRKASVKQKHLELPERDEFREIIKCIRSANGRFSLDCADFIECMAYTGCRKSEAANLRWRDLDFTREEVTIHGDPDEGTKGGGVRRIPMIESAGTLFKRMRGERTGELDTENVCRVREAQKSITRACEMTGIKRITHHDLRHLFATVCIEAAVDIPTLSRWLGHKDGGVLAMKTYGHLRSEHSKLMAKKVRF